MPPDDPPSAPGELAWPEIRNAARTQTGPLRRASDLNHRAPGSRSRRTVLARREACLTKRRRWHQAKLSAFRRCQATPAIQVIVRTLWPGIMIAAFKTGVPFVFVRNLCTCSLALCMQSRIRPELPSVSAEPFPRWMRPSHSSLSFFCGLVR